MSCFAERRARVWHLICAPAAALLLAGCHDTPAAPSADDTLSGLVVSESRLMIGAPVTTAISGEGAVAYISVAPGTIDAAQSVRIRNVTTGGSPSRSISVTEGGFDPVAVSASVGDLLELAITRADGAITYVTFTVPKRRPPAVVRTNPPKGRTDVALSIRPVIVFSEPIEPQSVNAGTVRLLGGTAPVSGTAALIDGNPFMVEFIPDAPLEAATAYELVITTALRDLQSESVEREVRVNFSTGAAPQQGLIVLAASGIDQPGKAGQELGEPLVVRVTNGQGVGVANVEVMWTVTSGEGVLDGRWNACASPTWEDVPLLQRLISPVATVTASTDTAGYARVSFMPTWFGPSTVTATVPGLAAAVVQFSTDASDPGARLEVGHEGQFEQAVASVINRNGGFSATVVDGQGNPVPYVPITWTLTSGAAQLFNVNDRCEPGFDWHTLTSRVGYSRLEYRPIVYGISTFTASVPGVQGSPITFTADATVMEVILSDDPWLGLPVVFGGPDFSADLTVPVGATVEFWNRMPSARIASTSPPSGGNAFDSGTLGVDGRFQFVPNVTGSWTFVDQVSGASGTLTVHPSVP